MVPVVFFVILIAALVAISTGVAHSGHHSGQAGECLVAGMLDTLPKENYTALNNVLLPTKDGITTQIDHVVVSRYGIFVIETKDYNGWIFGGEKQREWTQSFRGGRWGSARKYRFQNPIRQNWRHIYVLADFLKLPLRYFQNVVVFTDGGDFKTQMPANVVHCRQLLSYLQSFTLPVMSDQAIVRTISAICERTSAVTDEQRREHVQNLIARHDPVEMAVSFANGELRCPRCGAKMMLRHRHSDGAAFYGCSNYPNCKGILSPDHRRN